MSWQTLTAARTEDVWDALGRHVSAAGPRELPIAEALESVLACDVCARFDIPPFDRALMDGYAVRTADFAAQPATLRDLGLVQADSDTSCAVTSGTCRRINTGAPLPLGADAVVMVERSHELADGRITLDDAPAPGQYIGHQGQLARTGDVIVRGGTRVSPGTAAGLAAAGITHATVFPRPLVALLSTGSELVPPGQTLQPGQIPESNSVALRGLIDAAGGQAAPLGHCPDEPAALRAACERGLKHDLFCVTGGVSKGTHDLVPGTLEQLGVEWLVAGIHLQPGKPTRIGRGPDGGWVVGLPGNPVSCVVIFHLFVQCILDGLRGLPVRRPPHLVGRLETDLPANGDRPRYQPAEWSTTPDGGVRLSPMLWRGSGDPFALISVNALAWRPQHAGPSPRGDTIQFVPLERPR
ncbi:MAG: molybdopterin molybdotransferase MoeA [Planctomycetes bacterium]|nr:molybdopterin molybdotransferase MoeA [Planctomycetota bacterium]